MMGGGGPGTTTSSTTPAPRSGSALVAPRVSIAPSDSMGAGAAPALAALAERGRHIHVPGVRSAAKRAHNEARKKGKKGGGGGGGGGRK